MVALNVSMWHAYEWGVCTGFRLAYIHILALGTWPSGLYTYDWIGQLAVYTVIRHVYPI